ncbi:hypothetical protein E2C01_042142 [Portunus trituberculatus]|uniref:Uncharacterized protein n=1 Tax=Portunus trituberculatus TaxID=210409 RepID=A0A5B7FLQ1_PORTR|nr:hypothetical protein [Portunus trituberculatus]
MCIPSSPHDCLLNPATHMARSLLPREGFVVTDVFPVLVHDLIGGEGAQREVLGTLVTLLAVPRRLVILTVDSAVALPSAPSRVGIVPLLYHYRVHVPHLRVHVLNLGVLDETNDASAPPPAVVSAAPATVAATAATATGRTSMTTMVVVVVVFAYRYTLRISSSLS